MEAPMSVFRAIYRVTIVTEVEAGGEEEAWGMIEDELADSEACNRGREYLVDDVRKIRVLTS
jgi:hypothetical protein